MIGHAVSNVVPVVAANRIGDECGQISTAIPSSATSAATSSPSSAPSETGVLTATLDLEQAKRHRAAFGFFRDRRPDLYGRLIEDI